MPLTAPVFLPVRLSLLLSYLSLLALGFAPVLVLALVFPPVIDPMLVLEPVVAPVAPPVAPPVAHLLPYTPLTVPHSFSAHSTLSRKVPMPV